MLLWCVVCWIRFPSWPQRGGGISRRIPHLSMDRDLSSRLRGEIVRIWSCVRFWKMAKGGQEILAVIASLPSLWFGGFPFGAEGY